jgi:hypothetical protein
MINIFKDLNPLNILWLAILMFLLRAGYVWHNPPQTDFAFTEPFARLLITSPGSYTISPLTNVIITGVIIFAQALLVNYLVNHYNLLGKPTFLPALMYVTASGLFTPFLVLSPPLICNFLLIWMLFKLFSFYKNKDSKAAAYDLGMMVAVGSLIYFPFVYLFLSIFIGLIIFKPFNWRELAAAVIGYITIFFFLAVYYYWNNSFQHFYDFWTPFSSRSSDIVKLDNNNYLILIPVGIILLLCLFKLQQNFFKSYVQVRKSFQLLFMLFLMAGFSFYLKGVFNLSHFLLCTVPASVFFSYYFLYARARWFYESLFLLLLISIVYFQFNTF